MITAYLTLGLTPPTDSESADADFDKTVRAAYLDKVKSVGPTRDPERFARVGIAYAKVCDVQARAHYATLGSLALSTAQDAIAPWLEAEAEHRRPTLGMLAAACDVSHD